MPIDVTCGACGRAIKAPDKLAGKKVKCPQCATIVAVPAPRSADTPPARPGPARPTAQPQPARPKGASTAPSRPPGRHPSPPATAPQVFQNSPAAQGSPDFMGIGDLIQEELTRDYQKQMAAAEAEFERQQQEAARYAFEAPKRAAEEMRSKGVLGKTANARTLDLGFVFSRTWELYCQNFGMLLLAGFTGMLLYLVLNIMITGLAWIASQGLALVMVALVDDRETLVVLAYVLAGVNLLINFGGSISANSYVLAGQVRYTLNLAKDRPAAFLDVLMGGPFVPAMIGANFLLTLIALMPVFPQLFVIALYFVLNMLGVTKLHASVYIPLQLATWISSVVLLVFAVRLTLQRSLYQQVIVDTRTSGSDALETSSALVGGQTGMIFFLFLCVFGLMLAGFAAFCIGLLFAAPFCQLLVSVAYADISGAVSRREQD